MKTALGQNIDKINSFIDYVENSDSNSQMKKDFLTIFNNIKDNATSLLELEKKQLNDSFHAGFFIHEWDKSKEDKFEQYFSQTFSNE